VRLMPDMHPTSVELAWPMKLTLMAWFVPVFMLAGGLIAAKTVLNRRQGEPSPSVAGFPAFPARGAL